MPFKPGELSIEEANSLNKMERDCAVFKNIKVSPPLRIVNGPAGVVISQEPIASGSGEAQYAVYISTGSLITPGGSDLPYYAATEQSLSGGAWSTGDTVRAINTGSAGPKSGKRYPATYIGFASDGVTKCYAIKAGKTQFVTGVSLSCTAGTLTLTTTTDYIDIDTW